MPCLARYVDLPKIWTCAIYTITYCGSSYYHTHTQKNTMAWPVFLISLSVPVWASLEDTAHCTQAPERGVFAAKRWKRHTEEVVPGPEFSRSRARSQGPQCVPGAPEPTSWLMERVISDTVQFLPDLQWINHTLRDPHCLFPCLERVAIDVQGHGGLWRFELYITTRSLTSSTRKNLSQPQMPWASFLLARSWLILF